MATSRKGDRPGLRLPRPRRHRHLLPLLSGLVLALLFIHLFARLPVELGGFLFEAAARLDWPPKTRLLIPPVGEIRAATHTAPVSFHITLWSVDMEVVHALLEPAQAPGSDGAARIPWPLPDGRGWAHIDDLGHALAAAVRRAAGALLLRAGLLGLAGGVLGALVAGGWRPVRRWLAAGALGAAAGCLLLLPAYATYSVRAFSAARYTGIIEAAPWMIETVQEGLGRVEELGHRLRTIAGNLYTLFERIDHLGDLGLPPADLIVLHVSDLHNNVAALDLVQAVARRFTVDFIIDTGDVTDWATSLEADLAADVGSLGLPYLITPGNHESPLVVERLRATPNVRVLADELVTVMGLRIYGFTDPGASSPSPRAMSPEEAADRARQIAAAVAQLDEPVDIIAVHNHRVAELLPDGLAQAILFGHNHRLAVQTDRPTVRINAGTTGAAGIRGLQSSEPVPYSLVILYFSRRPPGSPPALEGAADERAAGRRAADAEGAVTGEGAGADGAGVHGQAAPDDPGAAGPAEQDAPLRLAVIDTIRVYTLPARALTLERIVLDRPAALLPDRPSGMLDPDPTKS